MSIIIGVDIGYGNVKVVSANGSGVLDGKVFKSVVGVDCETGAIAEGFHSEVAKVDVDGTKYLIGDSALKHSPRLLNVRDRGWIKTPSYKALLKHALSMAIQGKDVSGDNHIVTGLPVNYLRTDKENLEKVFIEVLKSLGVKATVGVIYQPMGTFFSAVLNENGGVEDKAMLNGRVGVFDIGFYTADLITIDRREVVETMSLSVESGISTALDAISKDIESLEEYGYLKTTPHAIENAVKRGKIKVFGEHKSITAIADRRLQELVAEMAAKAQTVWNNGADLDSVILTGGGALMLSKYWTLYKHARVSKSAPLANAIGYCKYAAYAARMSSR